MIRPVNGPLGQPFGADPATYAQFGMRGHNGQDLPVAMGTPVYAPEDGTVIISGNNVRDQHTGAPVDGETVVIQGGHEHWLLHNSQRLVSAGQHVTQGQIVAYSGYTGFVDPPGPAGAHCHWGVRPLQPDLNNGYRGFVDPLTVKENDVAGVEQPFNDGDASNIAKDFGSKDPDTDKNAFNKAKNWNDEYYGAISPRICQLVADRDAALAAAATRYDRLQTVASKLGVKNQDNWDAVVAALDKVSSAPATNISYVQVGTINDKPVYQAKG